MMADIRDLQASALVRVVDDDAAHCHALGFLLNCRGWRVETYTSAEAFMRGLVTSQTGCVILDVHMPGMSGLELQQLLNERRISIPVIFLTGYGDVPMAVDSMLNGAADFLQKPVDTVRLLASVEKACRKSAHETDPLFDLTPAEAARRLSLLTDREQQILLLAGKGLSNRLIAERLGISIRTVMSHRTSACKKLQTPNTKEILKLFKVADSVG